MEIYSLPTHCTTIRTPIGVHTCWKFTKGCQHLVKPLNTGFVELHDWLIRAVRYDREPSNHTNIAAIHRLEEIDSHHFLVMELVRAKHLRTGSSAARFSSKKLSTLRGAFA